MTISNTLRVATLERFDGALRRAGSEPYQLNVLTNFLAARDWLISHGVLDLQGLPTYDCR